MGLIVGVEMVGTSVGDMVGDMVGDEVGATVGGSGHPEQVTRQLA